MKKYLSSIVLALAVVTAGAQSFVAEGIAYEINEGRCEVTYISGTGYKGIIEIPSDITYEGHSYTVTGIGDYAFSGSGELSGVVLPNTITYLGRNAFQNCQSLTEIILPDNVTAIGEQAFYNCSSLIKFSGPGVIEIGTSAFSNCRLLADFEGKSLTIIGDNGFKNCSSLKGFFLANIKKLGTGVFSGCKSLENVSLPLSLTKIPEYTFSDCIVLKSVEKTGKITEIGDYAFNTCKSLTSFEFGPETERIGRGAFGFCTELSIDSINGANAIIDDYAFTDCISLRELKLVGVEEIREEAFANVAGLRRLILDQNTHYIRERAFRNCNAITFVECYADQPPFLANNAFEEEIYQNARLQVPYEKALLYRQTPPWSYFTDVTEQIPVAVTEIMAENRRPDIIWDGEMLIFRGEAGVIGMFSLDGKKIYEERKGEGEFRCMVPESGIYLIKYNKRIQKIYVK